MTRVFVVYSSDVWLRGITSLQVDDVPHHVFGNVILQLDTPAPLGRVIVFLVTHFLFEYISSLAFLPSGEPTLTVTEKVVPILGDLDDGHPVTVVGLRFRTAFWLIIPDLLLSAVYP